MDRWVIFGGLALAATALADEPLAVPEKVTVTSPSRRFQAVSDPAAGRTTVSTTGKRARKLWEVEGYHRIFFLSNHPVLIVGYDGNNLLPTDAKPTEVMLRFFKEGRLVASYTLADLVDPKELRPTTSHLSWGEYLGLHRGRFLVKLVDGQRLSFDPATGKRLP